nr:proteasome accessory factor PafA2 family protein [Actinomyces denticolens]
MGPGTCCPPTRPPAPPPLRLLPAGRPDARRRLLGPTRTRPLINTRDEPHADAELYRRMHVIVGAQHRPGPPSSRPGPWTSSWTTSSPGGTWRTSSSPSHARHSDTCHDLSGTALLERKDGRSITALDLQGEHLARVQAHARAELDLSPLQTAVIDLWERGLEALRAQDPGAGHRARLGPSTSSSAATPSAPAPGSTTRASPASRWPTTTCPRRRAAARLEAAGMLRRYVDDDVCRAAMSTRRQRRGGRCGARRSACPGSARRSGR